MVRGSAHLRCISQRKRGDKEAATYRVYSATSDSCSAAKLFNFDIARPNTRLLTGHTDTVLTVAMKGNTAGVSDIPTCPIFHWVHWLPHHEGGSLLGTVAVKLLPAMTQDPSVGTGTLNPRPQESEMPRLSSYPGPHWVIRLHCAGVGRF